MRLKIRFIDGSDMIFEHVEEIHENDKYVAFRCDEYREICVIVSNVLFIEKLKNE